MSQKGERIVVGDESFYFPEDEVLENDECKDEEIPDEPCAEDNIEDIISAQVNHSKTEIYALYLFSLISMINQLLREKKAMKFTCIFWQIHYGNAQPARK